MYNYFLGNVEIKIFDEINNEWGEMGVEKIIVEEADWPEEEKKGNLYIIYII